MKTKLVIMVMLVAITLGGCQQSQDIDPGMTQTIEERPVQEMRGKVVKTSLGYSLVSDGKSVEIVSKKINLTNFVDKEVGVVGEYSGTTLYVDEIK